MLYIQFIFSIQSVSVSRWFDNMYVPGPMTVIMSTAFPTRPWGSSHNMTGHSAAQSLRGMDRLVCELLTEQMYNKNKHMRMDTGM